MTFALKNTVYQKTREKERDNKRVRKGEIFKIERTLAQRGKAVCGSETMNLY